MKFPPFPFVVLDTETTGLTPRSDRILELALVRYEAGEKVAEYESLYSVDRDIPPHVQVLTRLRSADLAGQPALEDEKGKIGKLLEGAVIAGHNILFDIEMLKGEGFDLEDHSWIDTAMLASLVFPEVQSFSLSYLSTALDLPHKPKHRAMGDVEATLALLGKVWERFGELPQSMLKEIKTLAEKGPEGYAALFASFEGKGKAKPKWLKQPEPEVRDLEGLPLFKYSSQEGKKTWLTVKNLRSFLLSGGDDLPKGLSASFAPQFLLENDAADNFLKQDAFTAPELTLAIKLLLYEPKTQDDFPIHAQERDVWKGKLACTRESKTYTDQFERTKGDILLDHRQLLELLAEGKGPAEGDHVVIDDASMLEDTATKAFRWSCSIDPLRAAAEGNKELTSFLDVYQIWIEKVRNFQDVRYFVEADLTTKAAKGLRERLEKIMQHAAPLQPVHEKLTNLSKILDPANLKDRIAYISQFRDGGQIVQSVPEDVARVLKETLYDRFSTTLLLPPGDSFAAILSPGAEVEKVENELPKKPPLLFADEHLTLDRLLQCINGKAIGLVGSKRTIEQLFIKYTEPLEEKGTTLICQGFSGGLGRMQAEFLATEGPTVWLLTPWMYEGVTLPPCTVDHLWLHTLPFDHPSHAVLSRRAEHFADAFDDYFVPRLLHRLFRLLRSYCAHKKEDGNVIVLDDRIRKKAYGERVREYLEEIVEGGA